MARSVRWLLAVLGATGAFGVVLVVVKTVEHSTGPRAEADRWVVAVGFATVVSAAVLAWAGWWAGREERTSEPRPEPAARFHNEGNVYLGPTHTGSGPQFNILPDADESRASD